MICPCCGQPMDAPSAEGLVSLKWSALETTIIRCLVRKYPAGVPVNSLIFEVYGSRNDQPDTAEMCVRTTIVRLRKKLVPLGWQIPRGKGGQGNTHEHRLEKLP